jgi:hypothetical protein
MGRSNPSQDEYLERYKVLGLHQARARLNTKKELL